MSETQPNELSERELEILRLVATGASNKEVAQRLFISTNTVKVHLRNIFAKIGVVSRTEAAMYAVRSGLVASLADVVVGNDAAPSGLPISGDADVLLPMDGPVTTGSAVPTQPEAVAEKPVASRAIRERRLILIGLAILAVILLSATIWYSRQYGTLASRTLQPTPTGASRWTVLADLPVARQGMAVVTYEGQVYVIGGETSAGVTGAVECYDPLTNTWASRPAKPAPVTDAGAAMVGGVIYVPGGKLSSGQPTNVLEMYDPRQEQWEQRASLPKSLGGGAVAAYEGRLYVFGGWDGQNYLDTVYAYDPTRDEWETLSSMPTARAFAGAVVTAERVYVIGGYDGKQGLTVNEVYSPHLDALDNPWSQAEPMPSPRYGMGIVSLADFIYVLGGIGEMDGVPSSIVFVVQSEKWQAYEISPIDLGNNVRLAPGGESFYAIGGKDESKGTGYTLTYLAVYTVAIPIVR